MEWLSQVPLEVALWVGMALIVGALLGALLYAWIDTRRHRRIRPRLTAQPGGGSARAPQPVVIQTAGRGNRSEPEARPSESRAVLLVDDQIALLGLHAAYLRKHGYKVLLADNGRAGLESARKYHPDVIVLDYSMADLNGAEVARELKADPATADIPIVLLTAMNYGAVGPAARAAGCVAFLSKPVELSRLLREVEAFTRPERHA